MTTYPPGTVAMVVRYKGDETERVGIRDTHGWAVCNRRGEKSYAQWASSSSVTVLRPLVVIDPEANPYLKGTASWIDWIESEYTAQTRPPNPPEPTHPGAVITADEPGDPSGEYKSRRPVRTEVESPRCWVDRDGDWYAFAELTNATVIREGVTDA